MTCIHELFEAQVERTPDATAVLFEGSGLTYRELNQRADDLARGLRGLGVGPDVLVALHVERSLDMVVGMLGVLKAGGAYVPLDPGHPSKRLGYTLADAAPLVLLTQRRLVSDLPPHRARVVVMDADGPTPEPPMATPEPAMATAERAGSPRDLAYVIYTSGSTGEPKGVEVEHGSVVNMLASMRRRPGFDAGDTMLAITTLAFDIAVLEIFLPLTSGARVVIAGRETVGDGPALADLIARSGVSVMQATPATLRMLLDAGWQGDPRLKILCGGEAWTADLAAELLRRCGSLWNMYGPTETTVWSAVAKVEAGRPVVVGGPVAQTRLYVLDGARQLVPVGVPGELWIGGEGLARGYLRRPELTRERFVADPFSPKTGARMYRTGDQVRRLADGTLEFMGRLDHQVKIRGHRVELGEIEAVLARQPGIEQCVVVAREEASGEQCLAAYIIPTADAVVSPAELRAALGETLPAYMLPAAFVSLAAFPLTPNGKLDRKALPAPEALLQNAGVAPIAPRTLTEQVLARIWCDMLGREQVDVRDNFFDLGGHSLLAVRVVGAVNKVLNAGLNVPALFQSPTIEQLARTIEQRHRGQPDRQLVPLQSGASGLPLYFIGAGPAEYQLARLIGGDRAIFAIDVRMPVQLDRAIAASDRAALPTIEQLGALCADVLYAHAGSSPCVIVGHSFGGKIAFEAAHALQRAGGHVALVLLLDAWAFFWTGVVRGAGWQSLRWIWRSAATGTASSTPRTRGRGLISLLGNHGRLLWWLLTRIPPAVKNRLTPANRPSGYVDKGGRPIDQRTINRMARVTGKQWRPRPLDAVGVLFRARFAGEEMLPGYDIASGWSDLFAGGLEVVESTGDHVTMVTGENIATLARQIAAVLERHETLQDVEAGQPRDGTESDAIAQQQRFERGLLHTGHAV
jgi:amino acid adenylation domain-containing protein